MFQAFLCTFLATLYNFNDEKQINGRGFVQLFLDGSATEESVEA